MKFFKLLGRILFVLIFITTGYEKLSQPNRFIPILSDRYGKFEKFLSDKGVKLPNELSSSKLQPQMPLVNQIIAYEMIAFGLGVICFIPYMSLGLSLHLIVFTVVMNNPLYHLHESKEFYYELGQVVLSIGAFGISLMLVGEGRAHGHENSEGLENINETKAELEESAGESKKKEGKEGKSKKKKTNPREK